MPKTLIPISDATETEVEKAFTSFTSREPVIFAALLIGPLTWLLTNVGALVVGHTHLVTKAQWDSTATTVFPIASAVLVFLLTALVAFLVRRVVKPWWKDLTGRDLGVSAQVATLPVAHTLAAAADGQFRSLAGGGGGGGVTNWSVGQTASSTPTVPGERDLFDADLEDGPDEVTGTTSGAPDGAGHDPNTPGSSGPKDDDH